MRVRYSFSSRKTGTIEGTNKHKRPFSLVVNELINQADIILEVLDARFITETRNHRLEEAVRAKGKTLVFVLNKIDTAIMADVKEAIGKQNLHPYVLVSCKKFVGKKRLRERLQMEAKRLKLTRRALVGIVGYPNTGKSSLINLVIGRKTAGTSAQSGFTKGIQKITFTKDISVIDTPGVIAEEDAPGTGKENIAKTTTIGVKTYDRVRNPFLIVAQLMQTYPKVFDKHYNIDTGNDPEKLVEAIGRKNNLLSRGGIIDINRTARLILKDWQTGAIKR